MFSATTRGEEQPDDIMQFSKKKKIIIDVEFSTISLLARIKE
jgi:hypothetical protein